MKFVLLAAMIVLLPIAAAADFSSILAEVESAPVPPMLTLPGDRGAFLDGLEQAGRIAELGITRVQAGKLYDVLAGRMPVAATPKPRPYPGRAAAPQTPVRYLSEFDPQLGVFMRWPIGMGTYLPTYYGMMEALQDSSDVLIIVAGATQEQTVRSQCASQGISLDRTTFAHWPTDSVWTRDYGPIFIGEGEGTPQTESVLNMAYSRSWRTNDDKIPQKVAAALGETVYDSSFVQDGGNLLTDGRGTCFSSTQIYTNNPTWTMQQVADFFRDYLGCTQLITPEPLLNEGTGHIDMFLKVVGEHTVLVGQYDSSDANYQRLEDTADLIAGSSALDGTLYDVVRIPQNSAWTLAVVSVFHTYTNGLIAGSKVLVPQYNLADDAQAQSIYETLFPDREVVMVDSASIIQSGGAIHCITMERQDYSFVSDDDAADDTSDDAADDGADDISDDASDDDAADDSVSDDTSSADDTQSADDDAGESDDDDGGGGCGC